MQTVSVRLLETEEVVNRLAALRRDWEIAAGGKSLTATYAAVGLVLADICGILELDPDDCTRILGEKCEADITAIIATGQAPA